jgi:serine/threonine protein phosphatase 1
LKLRDRVESTLGKLDKKKHFIAIPDLHGSWQAAYAAIELLIKFDLPVIFLGDYCDRGASTSNTIEALIEAQQKRPDWNFIIGNHELMLLQSWESGEAQIADPKYPSAYYEYQSLGGVPKSHKAFLNSLISYFEGDSLLFVHGGVSEESVALPLDQVPLDELVWTYDISPNYQGKKIVRGHHVVETPEEHGNHINLDTGVGYGKTLSIGIVDDSPLERKQRLLGWIEMSPEGEILNFVKKKL